jgi:hypothetical protein
VAKKSKKYKNRPKLSVVGGDQTEKPRDPLPPADQDEDEPDEDERQEAARNRDDELVGDKDLLEKVRKVARDVDKGFQNQWERGNDQMDYWDIYDQVIGGKQAYAGNSTIYLPIVRQAVEARVTRFVNQIFPRSARNVDCITSDEKPYDIMALLEHYIRKARLRTQVMPALMRNGDIEGHYNLYVGWENTSRFIVQRTRPTLAIGGDEGDEPVEIEDPTVDDIEDMDVEEVETFHMQPTVEVLADCDVLVLPHKSNSVGGAIENGGCAAIIRRWSKDKLQKMIDDDEIDKPEGEEMLEEMTKAGETPGQANAGKKHVDAAGISSGSGGNEVQVYEIWTKLKIDGVRRLCRIYYAGGDGERVLSVRRNPYWCDKCPLLSAPLKKISNVFKGQSEVKAVADLQYAANDTVNEAMDSAAYALMPIVMTDPQKNPRVGSMVLNLAAIWETNPNDTKFAQFPALWKDGLTIVSGLKTEIFQILSVSPAQMPQSTGGKSKRNQAEVALEQQVDVLSTADVCTNLEDEILTPLLRWFVDLDYQYRDKALTVRQYGNMGLRAGMEEVPPIQNSRRFEFRWFGVEAARNAQMQQVQVSAINVVKGIPPQMYEGYKLRLAPFISQMLENAFGPRMTPELWESIREKLSMPAEMENDFLAEGLTLPVHELDDDQQHMKEHLKAMVKGDPSGSVREHLLLHREQMNRKMQMAAASLAQMQPGAPGGPGGAGPGVAGTPRSGAQVQMPRGGQQPAGAIHADRLQDPSAAPRR